MTTPWRTPVALAGVALLAVAFVGCADGAAATDPASSPVATTSVDLPKSYRFDPPVITVPAGATVTWTNRDAFSHNVSFDGEAAQLLRPGEGTTRVFGDAGTFAYICTLHPREMQGTVIVTGG